MSRAKFEEWVYEIENFCMRMDRLLDQFGTDGAMHQAWLAGRESMRDDVCPVVFGQCDSDNVAQRTVDAIRKIEP